MIDFAIAWALLAPGDEVQVSDGRMEPGEPDSLDHRIWRSHNFTGTLVEKIDGEPRQLRIELPPNELGSIAYAISEGPDHRFHPVTMSPEMAHAMRWEEAKAYRIERQCLPVPIPDILPGEIIVADADPESRKLIEGCARGAMSAIIAGTPEAFSLTFTDHTNAEFTVGAYETVAIGNFMLRQFTLCHAASQEVRKALDTALAGGATAGQILAIDITAGYPGDPAP